MPFNEAIAGRVRKSLQKRPDVVEKAMFGGITFMVGGNMCCGVHRDDLILRLDPTTPVAALGNSHARMWDFMKRPMPGMFAVAAAGCTDQASVDRLVQMALERALSLPLKTKARAKSGRGRARRPR